MSYANQAALTVNADFQARVSACAVEQANIFKDDGRAEIAALANMVLLSGNASGMVPMICGLPGFGDVTDQSAITDGQILSAVQNVWPTYAALVFPQS